MWYEASSVIAAIEQSTSLSIVGYSPMCPKKGNNIHCHADFPDCEGKSQKCYQSLHLVSVRGDPAFLYFDYYISSDTRKGRIKRKNSTLCLLVTKYSIDENLFVVLHP